MDNYDDYRKYAEADYEVIKMVNAHNKDGESNRIKREADRKARQLVSVLRMLLATVAFGLLANCSMRGITGPAVTVLCVLGTAASVYGLLGAMWRWMR